MYVRCSEVHCKRKAWLRPGKKQARCDYCREASAYLLELHRETPPTEEELAAEREARLTVRVGR